MFFGSWPEPFLSEEVTVQRPTFRADKKVVFLGDGSPESGEVLYESRGEWNLPLLSVFRRAQVSLARLVSVPRLTNIDAAAAAMMPGVFGALLDVVVEVMRVLPHLHVVELPRMADFAKILHAIDTLYPGMNAVEEYEIGVEEYASNLVKQHPVLNAIVGTIVEPWEGTSSDLLDLIGPKYPTFDDPAGLWPKTPGHMTSLLARSGPTFNKIGWKVEDLGSKNKQKTRRWRITPPQPEADFSTSSTNPHEDGVSGS